MHLKLWLETPRGRNRPGYRLIWENNNIQGEYKRTLQFHNDTENKCDVLRTSYLHQSIEKHSKFCFKWPGWLSLLRASAGYHYFCKWLPPQQRSWCDLQSAKKESVTAVRSAFRTQLHMEPPSRVSIYANHNCHSFHHQRHSAQNLGRVWLSSRHLPCDSRSTYRVSVRCVQNFESFSIDWCRCEFLSTPHLFSVSFLKC
jgi:hypothetical protein